MRVSDVVVASHPALAGHFPGDPIVPGVLLLARVARAAAALAGGGAPTAVPVAKFHAPLRPGERFEIELERNAGASIAFRVSRGDTVVASGTLRYAEPDAA